MAGRRERSASLDSMGRRRRRGGSERDKDRTRRSRADSDASSSASSSASFSASSEDERRSRRSRPHHRSGRRSRSRERHSSRRRQRSRSPDDRRGRERGRGRRGRSNSRSHSRSRSAGRPRPTGSKEQGHHKTNGTDPKPSDAAVATASGPIAECEPLAAAATSQLSEEEQMRLMLGFGGFDSTKGKLVEDNAVGAARGATRKESKREYRQYMNRRGGFNRPLEK